MLESFLLAFIPLLVAIDPIGVLPLFLALTLELDEPQRRRLAGEAVLTAGAASVVFLIAGTLIFAFLGITASDFQVGGGVVLLVLAVTELVGARIPDRRPDSGSLGIVPIGIPLMMGPAALTTIIILVDVHGAAVTLAALAANLALVWVAFAQASRLTRVLGTAGARAIAKIVALLLAGIAVMMIRRGITAMVLGMSSGPAS